MKQTDLQTIVWIFLIRNKKILLLQKKSIWGFVWTLPFTRLSAWYFPSEQILSFTKENLDIDIEEDMLLKPLIVNKVNKDTDRLTIWYFPSCITRKWNPKILKEKKYNWFNRFNLDNLPKEITEDLNIICKTFSQKEFFLEIN